MIFSNKSQLNGNPCTIKSKRITDLTLHGIGVQLAHVAAAVLLGDCLNMQIPGCGVRVADAHSTIVCYHLLVNGLNGFRVRFHPAHLQVI